jgi:protease I
MEETNVLFVIAFDGFQHVEYRIAKSVLENAEFTVITASDKMGTAIAADGSTQNVDYALDKINLNHYCGLFFIGGPGALEHLDNNTSYKIIQEAFHQNKPLGAICIATRIFAKAGILQGKKATGWDGDGELAAILAGCNAQYVSTENVIVDDNIITATGPSAAQQFGDAIVDALQKKQSWG